MSVLSVCTGRPRQAEYIDPHIIPRPLAANASISTGIRSSWYCSLPRLRLSPSLQGLEVHRCSSNGKVTCSARTNRARIPVAGRHPKEWAYAWKCRLFSINFTTMNHTDICDASVLKVLAPSYSRSMRSSASLASQTGGCLLSILVAADNASPASQVPRLPD